MSLLSSLPLSQPAPGKPPQSGCKPDPFPLTQTPDYKPLPMLEIIIGILIFRPLKGGGLLIMGLHCAAQLFHSHCKPEKMIPKLDISTHPHKHSIDPCKGMPSLMEPPASSSCSETIPQNPVRGPYNLLSAALSIPEFPETPCFQKLLWSCK